jgi:hypothetical protein
MYTDDVEARFDQLPEIPWITFQWLMKRGVPPQALMHPELPKRARVVFLEGLPYFDLAEDVGEDGVDALIFFARNDLGEPCDMVAWALSPKRLASWYGVVAVLGADDILAPRMTSRGVLMIHRTPLNWLRAERSGVVIIEPNKAVLELRDLGPLAAEDEAHGHELRALFRKREPEFFVPNVERRTAS